MNRIGGTLAAPLIALALVAAPVAAYASDDGESHKVALCHATASETNPYVPLEVAQAAFYNSGHVSHADDIFPAGSITKGGSVQEWAAQGDPAILANGCAVPPVGQPPAEEPPAEEVPVERPPAEATPVPAPVTLANHSCDGPGTITIPATEDVVYRLGFAAESGVWVALPAGSYPATYGAGLEGNTGDPRFGELIVDTLTVRAHQESTWDGGATWLAEWTITFTAPGSCETPVPPKPSALRGVEIQTTVACAADPADGRLVTTLQKRSWTRDWVLVDGAWKLDAKIFGDWATVSSSGIPWPSCEPDALTGVETRPGEMVCATPLDGTATAADETRTWTQAAAWDWRHGWIYGEPSFGDWTPGEAMTVESDECAAPAAETPPANATAADKTLASTGTEGVLEGMLAAVIVLLAGAGVILGRIAWDRRAERRRNE